MNMSNELSREDRLARLEARQQLRKACMDLVYVLGPEACKTMGIPMQLYWSWQQAGMLLSVLPYLSPNHDWELAAEKVQIAPVVEAPVIEAPAAPEQVTSQAPVQAIPATVEPPPVHRTRPRSYPGWNKTWNPREEVLKILKGESWVGACIFEVSLTNGWLPPNTTIEEGQDYVSNLLRHMTHEKLLVRSGGGGRGQKFLSGSFQKRDNSLKEGELLHILPVDPTFKMRTDKVYKRLKRTVKEVKPMLVLLEAMGKVRSIRNPDSPNHQYWVRVAAP